MDKMLKRELISIALSLENKITEDNNAMLQEICKFNDNLAKLKAELVVNKRVNSELCEKNCDNETTVLGKCSVLKKNTWNTSRS